MLRFDIRSAFRRKQSDAYENEIASDLNLAWDALASGDFQTATVQAEHILATTRQGSDSGVNAQLIILKMKT